MVLGIEAPDRDAHHEWQWAARAVGTRDQIVAARTERSPQRVTHRGEFDKFGVDLGQTRARACNPASVRWPARRWLTSNRSATSSNVKPSRCAALITRSTVTVAGGYTR